MKKSFIFIVSILLAFNAKATTTTDMVVATVNNQAITLQELKNRITLSKVLVNRELSTAEFNAIKEQSIEQLINEELLRQYAEEKGITILPKELNNAIAFIENKRGLEKGTLFTNIPEQLHNSAQQQIKSSIYEKEIVQQVIVPKVFIPEYQIDNLLTNVLNQSHTQEYLISQIIINNTENPQKDTQKIAKIYESLVAGDKFSDLVVAFSDGPKKLEGGQLGWFNLNELNFKLQNAVKRLPKGAFSKPVKDNNGWFIVKVDDIKKTENIDISETEVFKYVKFYSKQISRNQIDDIKDMANNVNGYTDFKNFKKLAQEKYNLQIEEYNDWETIDDINKNVKNYVLNTLPGNFSAILQNKDKSLEFVYVIDKQIKKSEQVETIKTRIERNLQTQEAERKFRQLKEDLRKKAFIELR